MKTHWFGIIPAALMMCMSAPLQAQDVSVTISEATINNLLAAIGPVKGKGKGARKISYSWTVTDPKVAFTPGASTFEGKIQVKAKGITIKDKVKGKLDVSYDGKNNIISMKVVEAKFPIKIKILGKSIKIATVDISKYYQPKFEFNGPEPVQKEVTVDVGGKLPRVVSVTVSGHTIKPVQDALVVAVNIAYAGRAAD